MRITCNEYHGCQHSTPAYNKELFAGHISVEVVNGEARVDLGPRQRHNEATSYDQPNNNDLVDSNKLIEESRRQKYCGNNAPAIQTCHYDVCSECQPERTQSMACDENNETAQPVHGPKIWRCNHSQTTTTTVRAACTIFAL
mmetsp:Transcript_24550/g.49235  ORF Transcript_24550/g.49235 Transcript_24550/m.49235 type:complete len:142 (+) Transcript_24550:55-480(+)